MCTASACRTLRHSLHTYPNCTLDKPSHRLKTCTCSHSLHASLINFQTPSCQNNDFAKVVNAPRHRSRGVQRWSALAGQSPQASVCHPQHHADTPLSVLGHGPSCCFRHSQERCTVATWSGVACGREARHPQTNCLCRRTTRWYNFADTSCEVSLRISSHSCKQTHVKGSPGIVSTVVLVTFVLRVFSSRRSAVQLSSNITHTPSFASGSTGHGFCAYSHGVH